MKLIADTRADEYPEVEKIVDECGAVDVRVSISIRYPRCTGRPMPSKWQGLEDGFVIYQCKEIEDVYKLLRDLPDGE